jgi:hypothetical protein
MALGNTLLETVVSLAHDEGPDHDARRAPRKGRLLPIFYRTSRAESHAQEKQSAC